MQLHAFTVIAYVQISGARFDLGRLTLIKSTREVTNSLRKKILKCFVWILSYYYPLQVKRTNILSVWSNANRRDIFTETDDERWIAEKIFSIASQFLRCTKDWCWKFPTLTFAQRKTAFLIAGLSPFLKANGGNRSASADH